MAGKGLKLRKFFSYLDHLLELACQSTSPAGIFVELHDCPYLRTVHQCDGFTNYLHLWTETGAKRWMRQSLQVL